MPFTATVNLEFADKEPTREEITAFLFTAIDAARRAEKINNPRKSKFVEPNFEIAAISVERMMLSDLAEIVEGALTPDFKGTAEDALEQMQRLLKGFNAMSHKMALFEHIQVETNCAITGSLESGQKSIDVRKTTMRAWKNIPLSR